jgi:hypothetical protein
LPFDCSNFNFKILAFHFFRAFLFRRLARGVSSLLASEGSLPIELHSELDVSESELSADSTGDCERDEDFEDDDESVPFCLEGLPSILNK